MRVIQEEIKVSEKFIKDAIEHYEKMDSRSRLIFDDFAGDKFYIIENIKAGTKHGNYILLMRHNFLNWLSKQKDL